MPSFSVCLSMHFFFVVLKLLSRMQFSNMAEAYLYYFTRVAEDMG